MGLKFYQWLEILGIVLLTGATATQLFILEPATRRADSLEMQLRLDSNRYQLSKLIIENTYILSILSPEANMKAGEIIDRRTDPKNEENIRERRKIEERALGIDPYQIASMNVYKFQQIIVSLFALGALFTVIGRVFEMRTKN